MKTKHKLPELFTYLIVLLFFVAGCMPTPTAQPSDIKSSDLVLTPEISSQSEAWAIPTPAKGLCVIHGRLVSEATGLGPAKAVYLAKNISAGNKDVPAMLSFSYQTSPRAWVDDEGYFYVKDVIEGEYAIALFDPSGVPYFVQDESGNDYLWIHAKPDLSLDLGTLNVP